MDETNYRKYHSLPSHKYPLFQNYQLVGDSQLVRFAELFLYSKRQYHQNSSGRVGYCIGGQTAQQLAWNLEQKAWPVCKNVILLIGTNDINHNTDPSEWKETLVKIIALFCQYGVVNVLMLTVPPVPKSWHTVEHWVLFVEYNETLKELETKYKDSFRSLQLLDTSSIFFTKSTHSTNCPDLYVACPVPEGLDYYDEGFMMSLPNSSKKWSRGNKDNSYLRENISLFDTVNMKYKLTNCVQGQTNDQDASINKNRFDLIGVTLTDVRNIKSKLLAINNEEYLYTLRHAFQKFLAHLKREIKEEKYESLYVTAYRDRSDDLPVQRKRPPAVSYDAPGDDLETSGVLCRSLDASDTPGAYPATSQVAINTRQTVTFQSTFEAATSAVATSTPMPIIPPFTIKSEISLRKSPLTSPVSSRLKRRGSKDNVWFELRDEVAPSDSNDKGGDRTHGSLGASMEVTVTVDKKVSTKGMHRRTVNTAMVPRQMLKQKSVASTSVPSSSFEDPSNVASTSGPSSGNSHNPSRQPDFNSHANRYPDPDSKSQARNLDPGSRNSMRTPDPSSRKPPDLPTGRKHRERSFRDVLGFIQKTLIDIKMENDPPATGDKHDDLEKINHERGNEPGPSVQKDSRRPLGVKNSNAQIPGRVDSIEMSLETSHFNLEVSNMKETIEAKGNGCEKSNNKTFAINLIEPSSSKENNDSSVVTRVRDDLSKSSVTPLKEVNDSRPYFLKSIEKEFQAKQARNKSSETQSKNDKACVATLGKSSGSDIVVTPWGTDIESSWTLNDSECLGALHKDTNTSPGSLLNDSIYAVLHDNESHAPAVSNNVRHVSLAPGSAMTDLQDNPHVSFVKNNLAVENTASVPNNLRLVNNASVRFVSNDSSSPKLSANCNNEQGNLNMSYLKNELCSPRDKSFSCCHDDPRSIQDISWTSSRREKDFYSPRNIETSYLPGNLRSPISERRSPIELVPMFSPKSKWDVNKSNFCASTLNREVSLHISQETPRSREVPNNSYPIQTHNSNLSYISNDLCESHYRRTNTNSLENNTNSVQVHSPNVVCIDNGLVPNEDLNSNVNYYVNNLNIDTRRSHTNVTDSDLYQRRIDSSSNRSVSAAVRGVATECDLYPSEVPSNRFITENDGSLMVRHVANNSFPPDAVVIDIESDTEEPSYALHSLPCPKITNVANNPLLPAAYNPALQHVLPASQHGHSRINKSSLNREMEIINKINSTLKNPPPHLPELSEDVWTDNQLNRNVPENNSHGSYYRRDLAYHETYGQATNLENNFNINNKIDSFTSPSSEYLHTSTNPISHSELSTRTFQSAWTNLDPTSKRSEEDFHCNLTTRNNNTRESPSSHSCLSNNLPPSYPLPDTEIPTGYKYLSSPGDVERKDASVSKKRSYEGIDSRGKQKVAADVQDTGAPPPERKIKHGGESFARSAHFTKLSDNKKYSTDMNDNRAPSTSNLDEADVLTIDYLTQDEQRDLEARLKKRAVKRDLSEKHARKGAGRTDGVDRNFLQRVNAIQFYQFMQAVTRHESNHDMTPLQEKTFYLHLRNMRSSEGSDLEAKFHHSMLGRYEFYKFMKYISLDYIVPKMFSNKFKKVMFTSLVDGSTKLEKYVAKSLDISVFETHFSRLAHSPRNKAPRVDLVHLNQKGFELLRDCLSRAISEIERRDLDVQDVSTL